MITQKTETTLVRLTDDVRDQIIRERIAAIPPRGFDKIGHDLVMAAAVSKKREVLLRALAVTP